MATGPRKGKMKSSPKAKTIAELKTISPGVMVNKGYTPGADPALDATLKKLKGTPPGPDNSGLADRWKV